MCYIPVVHRTRVIEVNPVLDPIRISSHHERTDGTQLGCFTWLQSCRNRIGIDTILPFTIDFGEVHPDRMRCCDVSDILYRVAQIVRLPR